jgi:hypothetical protein
MMFKNFFVFTKVILVFSEKKLCAHREREDASDDAGFDSKPQKGTMEV